MSQCFWAEKNLLCTSLKKAEPAPNCRRCPRLKTFINEQRKLQPDWHNAPVKTWCDDDDTAIQLLVVGLAPGLKGANRTGKAFTGDQSGDLLFATLKKLGNAFELENSPGITLFRLKETAITNAVRCVPPQNKPTGLEINTCRQFLANTIARFPNLRIVVTLGSIAHQSTLRALDIGIKSAPFGHNTHFEWTGVSRSINLISSYHCSRYNVNTGRLTAQMFEDVFENARAFIGPKTT